MRLTRRQACASSFYVYSSLMLSNLFGAIGCGIVEKAVEPDLLTSLAFGSCNKQDMLTKHWPIITGKNAQSWLWMGDAIYADGMEPKVRAKEYQKLLDDKGYQALTTSSYIMGTWDDHDYASNDSGAEYADKVESQKVFLDFLGEPLDSARRTQQGVYLAKDIGKIENQVQFILLDMRYFKEKSGVSADPIGPAQWLWLEEQIRKTGPALKVIVSSIQLLTDFTGRDTWACFPEAQTRFMNLLATSNAPVFVVSGDRHLTETSKKQLTPDRIIHEITSSGLTHTTELRNSNIYRVQEQILETNFGLLNLEWDVTGKPLLKSLRSSLFSPQSGSLLREFSIPLTWG